MQFFRRMDLLTLFLFLNGTTGALLHSEMERAFQSCTVAEIHDGDTLTAQCGGGRELRVRISSIDAPELAQRHGREAREALASLTVGGALMVRVGDTDKYGRTVASIQLPDGRDVAREMVAGGHAWHYVRYSKDPELASLEVVARESMQGLWRDPSPVAPSEYRRTGGDDNGSEAPQRAKRSRRSERRSEPRCHICR